MSPRKIARNTHPSTLPKSIYNNRPVITRINPLIPPIRQHRIPLNTPPFAQKHVINNRHLIILKPRTSNLISIPPCRLPFRIP